MSRLWRKEASEYEERTVFGSEFQVDRKECGKSDLRVLVLQSGSKKLQSKNAKIAQISILFVFISKDFLIHNVIIVNVVCHQISIRYTVKSSKEQQKNEKCTFLKNFLIIQEL